MVVSHIKANYHHYAPAEAFSKNRRSLILPVVLGAMAGVVPDMA